MTELVMTPNMVAEQAANEFAQVVGAHNTESIERMRLGAWVASQAALEIGPSATVDAIKQHAAGAVVNDWAVKAVTAVRAHDVADGVYGTIVPERHDSLAVIAGLLAWRRDHLRAEATRRQELDFTSAFTDFSWTGISDALSRKYPSMSLGGKAVSRRQQPEGEQ